MNMKKTKIRSLNDSFYLLAIPSVEYEPFVPSRIHHLQKKYKINIEIHVKCPENGSAKFYVPVKKKYQTTLCFLLEEKPRTSKSLIENFELINDRKKLFHKYICDMMKNCKYTTSHRAHYERHRRLCRNYNTPKEIFKQKTFGSNDEIFKEMIEKGIIPWYAADFRTDFICTFDCETLESKIEGPENQKGLTDKAVLNLLSIAVGTNCESIESKCWIRKSSAPEEEEKLGQI